jgi:SSS family solute:Na+ symporter
MNFNYLDLIIIVVYVLFIFFAGSIVKKYIKGIDDYLVAGRSMGFSLGLISLMCTEIGMITYVYFAELGYGKGLASLMVAVPFVVAFLFLGKTGFVIKKMMEMKIMTVPEFFSKRYSKGVRLYLGIIMAIGGILNFGVFPGVEAKFINIVTGIPEEFLLYTMVALLTIVLLYTLVGGMVSVIVTNYVQYALLSFGMIIITIIGFNAVGWDGIMNAVSVQLGEKGVNPFDPSFLDGDFGLGFLVWQILMQISLLIGWQAVSARLFASKDSKTGQKIYRWSALMFFSRAILPIFWGIIAFAYYTKLGIASEIQGLDALPNLIKDLVPHGILGLIFAGLLAASMSTYASYLLSWSSIVSQDIVGNSIKFITGKELSSKKQLQLSRIVMAVVMLFIIWWSLFHKIEGFLYFYLNMTAMLFIPGTLISVAMGVYWDKARTLGAYLAITFGAVPPLLYLVFPEEITKYASEMGYGGFIVALIGMIIGSGIQNIYNKSGKLKETV